VDFLGENINTIKINIMLNPIKVVATEVKAEIPMFMAFYQDTGKNHNRRTTNKPLKNVAKFRY
jgi:hypothetical protein